MRTAIPYLAIALILLGVGAGLWTIGRFERRMVSERQQLLTLDYSAPLPRDDWMERFMSIRFLQRIPWIASQIADIRALRATSTYWQRDYPSLALERDLGGAWLERSPMIMRLAANAAFRRVRESVSDRANPQRLNDVLGIYAEVLRRDPQFDVAFNYELVARTRDALTRRGSNRPEPSEATILGRPGAPPAHTDMRQFKLIIPQGTEERLKQPDAVMGGPKSRKG